MNYYTGVGSRNTPVWCRLAMEDIATSLAGKGYSLRSGSAQGADSAFEIGADNACGAGDIYIPWSGFGTGRPTMFKDYHVLTNKQFEVARDLYIETGIIPHFNEMKQASQKLHARNYLQVVGHGVTVNPSKVCLYYAEGDWITGEPEGGTRSAVMLSRHFGVPIYNLMNQEHFKKVQKITGIRPREWYIDNQDMISSMTDRSKML